MRIGEKSDSVGNLGIVDSEENYEALKKEMVANGMDDADVELVIGTVKKLRSKGSRI